ncbi:MAG: carbonic anhydrase [Pseudomonadota bacterium]
MASPEELTQGFQRFRERHFAKDNALYSNLVARGQTPKTLIVGCCDSRVDPSLILDCAPGDLFVIRNVANLVPPADPSNSGHHGTSAALEFGVRNLQVAHVIVMGHAQCGGIGALVQSGGISSPDTFIGEWMHLAESARAEVMREMPNASLEDQIRSCEQRAILVSLRNLMTFSWVRERVENGTLTLHGWYFDIEHGRLLRYNSTTGAFE